MTRPSPDYRRTKTARRFGNALLFTLAAIVVVIVAAALGWWFWGRGSGGAAPQVLISRVSKGAYDFVVIEQGAVESESNVEVKCEVRSRGGGGGGSMGGGSSGGGGGGITILEVIPEGTMVEGPTVVDWSTVNTTDLKEVAVKDLPANAVDAARDKYVACTITAAWEIKDKTVPFEYKLAIETIDQRQLELAVKMGTLLVKLDSAALEQEQKTQMIKVNGQQSLVVEAKNKLTAAQIALKEYLEGTFRQEKMLIENEVFTADKTLRSAQLGYTSAQRLGAKGLLNPLQLEGEQIVVKTAENSLALAQSKLRVLEELTKKKMETQFNSDISTAEAKVKSEQSSLALEEEKLAEIEKQISKCTIRARVPGQVVYANKFDYGRGGSTTAEFVVEAGSSVREGQAIIRLPDSSRMQVKASVNEARITLVRPGLPVTIRVDALKDNVLRGEVVKVNQYADPSSYSTIRKYSTFIKILNPPADLRSGMNAEARIHVERSSDALQVPVQAVAEHKGKFFTLVQNGDSYETREIEVGTSNDKVITIKGGLAENDAVVMNPRAAGNMLVLPDLPDPTTPKDMADIARTKPGEAPVRPTSVAGSPGAVGSPGGTGAPGGRGGGEGGGGRGGKGKGRGNMTPAMLVDRYLQSDADGDGKLSKDEVATMDDRAKQGVAEADRDADGFLDRTELTSAAAAAMARMREQRQGGGGPGGPGGGGPGGGGGGPGGGPAVTGGGE
jgi:HlyD family secretion protein